MQDIIKGVVYDMGERTLGEETRQFSMICLVVSSEESILPESGQKEFIVMGRNNISDEIKKLTKYECPYKFGDISNAIVEVSHMVPSKLEKL